MICDESGYAESKDLPYGWYTVHQIKGWDGREFIEDFDVFISENGNVYRYLLNNANFESRVKIVKKDAEVLTIRENTHLDKMAKSTISMVSKSIQSLIKQNLIIAHEVIEQDDTVDELFNRVKKETISLIHEDPGKGEECVAIVMIAKYFERIGDHASNIAEWVEFAITGEYKGGSL